MRTPRARAATAGLAAATLIASGPAVFPTAAQAAPGDVTVAAVTGVQLTDEGGTARVGVRVTVEGGAALAAPVVLPWTTGAVTDTATPGVDYRAARGTLRFPTGTRSGSVQYVQVRTTADRAAETAETITVTAGAAVTQVVVNAHGLPYLDPALPVARRVNDLVSRMTLAEKVGQMTQAERAAVTGNPALITTQLLGSLLSGGGSTPAGNTPEAWADMIDAFQTRALATRLQIPMIYGVDSVHGHSNLYGATIFPHNIGLGATRNPALVKRTAHVTAEETRATGVPWTFAPCLCVARDTRWGRTYESFGEDPALPTSMAGTIEGFQGRRAADLAKADRVLATAKHFAGDGDTEYGTGEGTRKIDQGDVITTRADFERIDLAPYWPAIRNHRAGTVMPSYSTVDWIEDGVGNKLDMHEHRELLTDYLKGRMDFDGFVISDWEGIHDNDDVTGLSVEDVRLGVNAGIDMFMQPNNAGRFIEILLAEVAAGTVSQARIDDAVRRILTKKFEVGLFAQPFADRTHITEIGSAPHRRVARQAVAESQVLLKNAGGVLPLKKTAKVYVAGRNAHDIGNQSGGWTITWQGVSGAIQPGTTVLEGIRQVAPGATVTYSADGSAPVDGSDVAVVVVGETPYSEGNGDVGGPVSSDNGVPREPKRLELQPGDQAVVDKVCAATRCVVVVVSGRPQVVGNLGDVEGLVASWLPGTEGAGVADVLFGRRPFTGRLPMTWPRTAAQEPINVGDAAYDPQFPFGFGLRTDNARDRLNDATRAALVAHPRDRDVQAAVAAATRALAARNWTRTGAVKNTAAVAAQLDRALVRLDRSGRDVSAFEGAVVSVLRDVAQRAYEPGDGTAALIGDADVALLDGDALAAGRLLARAF
ncbi:glycoside hydrolase family 3 N-terminal domain-containing protein [Spirilliplanes yamanashiensis]|uniref:beta-glucosidase n=1 Tax=Spirilliplanes yamanashiensis TaxID=42233 RepID=A0A8J3YD06_9ACTN|nr:glycoside hydrolase family 3 N-terminal domain-containing protein [Spirilliplanes yamanashiensis]MDP9819030.1 beta-glucosidase [Spirilliplanes yamanashiensis]GIJ05485.1 hypothetical protein Sya03_48370 [Spirilliplanes yamanashiensis]